MDDWRKRLAELSRRAAEWDRKYQAERKREARALGLVASQPRTGAKP